jgi:hypothetical protein
VVVFLVGFRILIIFAVQVMVSMFCMGEVVVGGISGR